MDFYVTVSIFLSFIYITRAVPQYPEINDQYEQHKHNNVENITHGTTTQNTNMTSSTFSVVEIKTEQPTNDTAEVLIKENPRRTFATKLYESISIPINNFVNAPRVTNVIRNIGTCVVNGVMELIAFYLPAPLIPLVASAAGMFIPFEPVVLLKQKMPVTSYRRAFRTAMDSFMGTFDRYKMVDDDPYMTNRFNRRFMGNTKENKDGKVTDSQ